MIGPLLLSLQVGLLAAAIGLAPAAGLGWWLARTRSRWRPVVTTLVMLPLVLPPVVTGWLLLRLVGRRSWVGALLGELGLAIPFTPAAAVIAAVVVGLPLYVMSARAAFEGVDRRYEDLSATLGDPPLRTMWRVTLPLAAPGLAGGAVLAFARALGELGATIVLAGNTDRTRTLSIAVYALLDAPDGEARTVPLVLASIVLSLTSLVGYEALLAAQRRRQGDDHG